MPNLKNTIVHAPADSETSGAPAAPAGDNAAAANAADAGGIVTQPGVPIVGATAATAATAKPDMIPTAAIITPLSDEAKLEVLGKAIRNREVFNTIDEAVAKFTKGADETGNYYGLPYHIRGMATVDSTEPNGPKAGEIDKSIYDGLKAVLATVSTRVPDGKPGGNKILAIKGIMIYPQPATAAFEQDEKGLNWLDKIVSKECSLIVARKVRGATTLNDFVAGVESMPGTVDEFVTEYGRGADDDADTFSALWSGVRQSIKENTPALYALLPAKPIMEKCMRSRAYALESKFAPLDITRKNAAGEDVPTIIERLLDVLIAAAEGNKNKDGTPNPLPVDGLKNWKATRNELVLTERKEVAKDFGILDSLNF